MTKIASNMRVNGYTLTELVLVIVLIGIVSAATVMININSQGQHSVTVQADEFRRNLSHLQLLAISQSKRLKLTVNEANYTVSACTTSACTTTVPLTDPATGQNFSVNLTGVTFTLASRGALDFDSLGRPQSGGSLISTNPARTYTLTGSDRSVRVTVLPITGFAQTTY